MPDRSDAFTAYAADYLRQLRGTCRQLCFQIGSNRGGDKRRPLFAYDDDVTRLEWSCRLLADCGWRIRHAGVAARGSADRVRYEDLPGELLPAAQRGNVRPPAFSACFARAHLAQFPGEFYRRPLFVCEAG